MDLYDAGMSPKAIAAAIGLEHKRVASTVAQFGTPLAAERAHACAARMGSERLRDAILRVYGPAPARERRA